MPDEKTFFNEGSVSITNTRAIIGSTTYAMSNVTSVSLGIIKKDRVRSLQLQKMKIVLLLIMWLLSACSENSGVVRTILPDGERGYSVSCENSSSLNKCYELAGDVCFYGYDIVNMESQNGFQSSALGLTGKNIEGITGAASANSTWQKGLLIKCKWQFQVDSVRNLLPYYDERKGTNYEW
jgi:hypothetical protein